MMGLSVLWYLKNKTMHICFLTNEYPHPNYPHGGIGTFVKTLAEWLNKKGVKVSIVGINYSNEDTHTLENGIDVYRLKNQKTRGLGWYVNGRSLSKKIKEIHDINPINFVEGSELSFFFIKKHPAIHYIIRLHGGHHFFTKLNDGKINIWRGIKERISFLRADSIIGVSKFVVEYTFKYLNYYEKLKAIIPNPVDIEKFKPSLINKTESNSIFFAGTVCEKKGIKQLILAMPLVIKQIPDVKLFIAGRDSKLNGSNSSYIDYLKLLIPDNIKDSIVFLGSIPNNEIPSLIDKAKVCCYPSLMESFGIAWIEVMSMSKALVASDIGPAREIIENNISGLLCNPHEKEDIANKIIKILKNEDLAKELGQNARNIVCANYSIDVIGQQNLHLYKSLI